MLIAAFLQTYGVDGQVADNAATATALFTGVKTKLGTVGYDSSVVQGQPESIAEAEAVSSILRWAQDAGKATGRVWNSTNEYSTLIANLTRLRDDRARDTCEQRGALRPQP